MQQSGFPNDLQAEGGLYLFLNLHKIECFLCLSGTSFYYNLCASVSFPFSSINSSYQNYVAGLFPPHQLSWCLHTAGPQNTFVE